MPFQLYKRWLANRKWHLIVLILLSINVIFVMKVYKSYKSFRHEVVIARAEYRQVQADVLDLKTRLREFSDTPLAYAETPRGLKLVPVNQGVSKADIEFISRYRGPIIGGKKLSTFESRELSATLRVELLDSFKKTTRSLSSEYTERQSLIAHAVLRTHGSIPVYEVRDAVPNDLDQIVLGPSGNCSDYTIRLLMVMEALGLKASLISSVTPNLGGHVFVDAYDPEEDTSYLLDANFSVMIIQPQSKGRGFLENLLTMSDDKRVEFAKLVNIVAFPVYFRFVDPGATGVMRTPLTPEFINEQRADREPMWRRWLAQDMEQLVGWWHKAPGHAPRTLQEFSEFLSVIPAEFNGSADYAANLRQVAGIEIVVYERGKVP